MVFLAFDAGEGYPTEHPRLLHGNTAIGYRKSFGHLDYIWRRGNEQWQRDSAGEIPSLSADLLNRGSFILYPYVNASDEMIGYEVHQPGIEALASGATHSDRELLLRWKQAYAAQLSLWSELSDTEMNFCVSFDAEVEDRSEFPSDAVRDYLTHEKHIDAMVCKLGTQERHKILQALTDLCVWFHGFP